MDVKQAVWVERYRPETLDDIIGNDGIVDRLKYYANDAETPNLMFEGPAGTGKTAMVQAFARELYGDEWEQNVLELNASDDRGINVVRDRIKSFASTGTVGDHPFKLIFLDEVDSTTNDAQSAMRRVMEDYADTTRFVMSCNYANKIIPPIQSRCVVYSVSRLGDAGVEEILQRVISGEGIDVTEDALERLVDVASGDARKAINTLQGATLDDKVTLEGVETVTPQLDYNRVREILDTAIAGDLSTAQRDLDVDILKEGVSPQAFLDMAFSVVKKTDMPEDSRAKAINCIAECDYRLLEGASPHVQLHNVLATIHVAAHLSLPNYGGES